MDLKCPKCGRWLSEIGVMAGSYGRAVCGDCGIEVAVTVRPRGGRRAEAATAQGAQGVGLA